MFFCPCKIFCKIYVLFSDTFKNIGVFMDMVMPASLDSYIMLRLLLYYYYFYYYYYDYYNYNYLIAIIFVHYN